MELSEAQSTNGLNMNSNAWVYDQNHQTVTVFADPSSITMFYSPTPTPEFPSALAALILIGSVTATMFVVKRRPSRNFRR